VIADAKSMNPILKAIFLREYVLVGAFLLTALFCACVVCRLRARLALNPNLASRLSHGVVYSL